MIDPTRQNYKICPYCVLEKRQSRQRHPQNDSDTHTIMSLLNQKPVVVPELTCERQHSAAGTPPCWISQRIRSRRRNGRIQAVRVASWLAIVCLTSQLRRWRLCIDHKRNFFCEANHPYVSRKLLLFLGLFEFSRKYIQSVECRIKFLAELERPHWRSKNEKDGWPYIVLKSLVKWK